MLMTRKELLEKLMSVKGASPITIISKTEPKLLVKHRETKEPCPYKDVTKTSVTNGMMNFDYEAAVNRQRTREESEADFKAKERTWGTHVTRSIIEHKGKYYLQMKVQNAVEHKYICNGEEVSIDKGYLPAQSNRQGVKQEVIVRDYALDSVHQVKMGGQVINIV